MDSTVTTKNIPINVKDYGAKGDGVTDDTIAIQTAYNLADNLNKSLYIPNGDYLVSGLVFDKCINVIGESQLARFLANLDNITIVKFENYDKTPTKAYIYTVGNFAIWANDHTNCIGFHSYRCNGYYVFNVAVDGCVQGLRLEADQFCQYTNIMARNCTIGIRMVDDTNEANGAGNNNQINSPYVAVCDIGYMFGRPNAPYPLHTVTVINAIALECSFSSYVVYNYSSITFTNCSPESGRYYQTGLGVEKVYDGCTVYSGLGYFNNVQGTIRDSIVATDEAAFILHNNSLVAFDDFCGANCSVLCDSTSIATFSNGLLPGNASVIDAVNIDSYVAGFDNTNLLRFPHEVQFVQNLTNYVDDPVKLLDAAYISDSVNVKVDWHKDLGICGSMIIKDGTSGKGLSATINGGVNLPIKTGESILLGISLVSNKNCQIRLGVPGQCLVEFSLEANIPQRVYVTGSGNTTTTIGYFDLDINDNSGSKLYFGKAMLITSAIPNGKKLISRIIRDHLYNSKVPHGDFAALLAPPTVGTFKVGDVVYNKAPTAKGYLGWVCVKAGTPGTWKGFGLIQA